MNTSFRQSLTVLALTLLVAASARAQLRIAIGPVVGAYSPVGNYREPFGTNIAPEEPSQNSGLALGVAGRLWFTHRLGLQLQGSTSSASLAIGPTPAGGGTRPPLPIRITSATVEAVVNVAPRAWNAPLRLGLGGGIVHHAGQMWDRFGAPTNAVVAASLGTSIPIDRRFAIDLGVSSLMYRFHVNAVFDHGNTFYMRGFQADLMPHVGLMFALR